ncbi:hypothetical protein NCCP2331_07120 [Sporosarcina sp. NCCP-2331]|nr:hypothetical protein NCCP2331_07120 [Sporosarcina sp. NCCP-2331]GLB54568.1 hypothetical protein NCCP2378_03530 [Sporosarcina sp. NCCP-2378]
MKFEVKVEITKIFTYDMKRQTTLDKDKNHVDFISGGIGNGKSKNSNCG